MMAEVFWAEAGLREAGRAYCRKPVKDDRAADLAVDVVDESGLDDGSKSWG